MLAFSIQYRSGSDWARCGSSGMFLFLMMVDLKQIGYILQYDKLWQCGLVAKNFDD